LVQKWALSEADYNRGFIRDMVNSSSEPASAVPAASYEDALAELERLVAAMEGSQMPLDRLLGAYQRGAQLLALCRSQLDAVEHQVKVLEDDQLKPWSGA
jgi:exodeoxyribonuclease VII small subunit